MKPFEPITYRPPPEPERPDIFDVIDAKKNKRNMNADCVKALVTKDKMDVWLDEKFEEQKKDL